MKTDKDTYNGKPWKNSDEYHTLVRKYHLAGGDLIAKIKEEEKKARIPYPVLTPPHGNYTK